MWWCWGDGVIPLRVEVMRRKLKCGELCVRDALLELIGARVPLGMDSESMLGRGRTDQVHDDLMTRQRASPPVHADMRKKTMLDLVPLAGTRRQMAYGHRQPSLRRPPPKLMLPEAPTVGIAPAPVSADQELPRLRVFQRAIASPPSPQALNREGRGVMVLSNVDPSGVPSDIVNSIGNSFAQQWVNKVMHVHGFRARLWVALPGPGLVCPHQPPLLCA